MVLLSEISYSQPYNWIGGTSNQWGTPSNWNPSNSGHPNSSDDVIIGTPDINDLEISGTEACKSITFTDNGIIYFASTGANRLEIYGDLINNSSRIDIVGNSNGTLVMRGNTDTDIDGSTDIELFNLKIQKQDETKMVSVNVPLYIRLKLDVLPGILDANELLTLMTDYKATPPITAFVEPNNPDSSVIINKATVQQSLAQTGLYYHFLSSPVGDRESNSYYTIGEQFSDNQFAPYYVLNWVHSINNTIYPDWIVYDEPYCKGISDTIVQNYYDSVFNINITLTQAMWILTQFGWECNVNVLSDHIQPGQGVCSRVSFDKTSDYIDWQGILNNGEIHVNITKNDTCADFGDGINLIGNPFPSPIDFDLFYNTDSNATYIAPYAYIWTPDPGATTLFGSGFGDGYFSVIDVTNSMSNIPSPNWYDLSGVTGNHYIAIGQGFSIFATSAGGVSFDNSCRVGSNTPSVLRATKPVEALQLLVQSASGRDYTNIYLSNLSSDAFDMKEDAPKMLNPMVNMATISEDKMLMINRLSKEKEEIEVPLMISMNIGEEATLSIGSAFFESIEYVAIFIDKRLKTQQVINANFTYTFTQQKGDENERFVIKFVKGIYAVNNNINSIGSMYLNNQQLNIFTPNINQAQVILSDASGRMILQEQVKFNDGKAQINLTELSSGIYMVSVQNNTESFTQKLMINK